jgi:hypothetical protein
LIIAWDDNLVDGVDTINAVRWNAMVTDQKGRSLSSHTHNEFQLYSSMDCWYVYLTSGTYYAKNLSTGTIDYSGSDFSTVMTSVIGAITNSGFIKLGTGTFVIKSAIVCGDKPVIIEGSGWGRGGVMTNNPGTLLKSDTSGSYYLLQFGAHGTTVEGAGIRNCMFMKDGSNTACYGAVDLYNTVNSFVDHCYFYGFELAAGNPMTAISIHGATDEVMGGWCNRATFNHIVNPDIGILLAANANYCVVEGNHIEGSGTASANGIKCDGTNTGVATTSPYGCLIAGNRIRNFDYGAVSRGLWITSGCNNSGRHAVIGNIFNECTINFEITSGTGIGECTFVSNVLGTAGSYKSLDSGNVKSYYYNNKNYVTENWGAAASKTDGSTITHGLDTTPTVVLVTGTVATEVISVTAVGTTTFTLAIKKCTAGTWGAGTTQTIYWRAWVI